MTQRFPLDWPANYPRASFRTNSQYQVTFARARDEAIRSAERMGAEDIIISSDIPVRLDGLPRAGARPPQDPGIAMYFSLKGQPMSIACDKYQTTRENMRAIGLTLESLRGIKRAGCSELLDRAFTGFNALPQTTKRHWRQVLGLTDDVVTVQRIKDAYRRLAATCHPDRGGSDAQMAELNRAKEEALKEIGR